VYTFANDTNDFIEKESCSDCQIKAFDALFNAWKSYLRKGDNLTFGSFEKLSFEKRDLISKNLQNFHAIMLKGNLFSEIISIDFQLLKNILLQKEYRVTRVFDYFSFKELMKFDSKCIEEIFANTFNIEKPLKYFSINQLQQFEHDQLKELFAICLTDGVTKLMANYTFEEIIKFSGKAIKEIVRNPHESKEIIDLISFDQFASLEADKQQILLSKSDDLFDILNVISEEQLFLFSADQIREILDNAEEFLSLINILPIEQLLTVSPDLLCVILKKVDGLKQH
jgi:hypothetical protein